MESRMWLFLSFISLGLILVGCKDDEQDGPAMVTPDLDVQMRVGTSNLSEGDVYTINGTVFQIDIARFYMGGIKFSGTNEFSQDDYYIVSDENRSFNLNSIEEGTYDFEFAIGVDADTNSQSTDDFTTRPAGDPLGLQMPEMHWNWSTGYKFLRIDGLVDTDGDSIPDAPVQYHLGSNAFYAPLVSPEKITLDADNKSITIRFDLEGLFNDVDLSTGESTHVGDNKPLADQLFANYTQAVSIVN